MMIQLYVKLNQMIQFLNDNAAGEMQQYASRVLGERISHVAFSGKNDVVRGEMHGEMQ